MDYIYGIYTTVFGVLTLLFALGFWIQKDFGWIGTFATLLFVAVADALTLLNLPSVPGIPKFAAVAEIAYSVIVLAIPCSASRESQSGKNKFKPVRT